MQVTWIWILVVFVRFYLHRSVQLTFFYQNSALYIFSRTKKNEEARTFGLRISEYTEKIDFAHGLGDNAKKFERT